MRTTKNIDTMSAGEYVTSLSSTAINSMFKIAGTDMDRRRKVTKMQRRLMRKMVKHDVPVSSVARYFGVSNSCVKYITDAQYRKISNAGRTKYPNYNNSHFKGENAARAQYKLDLISAGKMGI